MTKEKENLLKMTLFILCMETVSALLCTQCSHFVDLVCEHDIKTCYAGTNESCMIRRNLPVQDRNEFHYGETKCMKDCQNSERSNASGTVLTYCCKQDFCNDITIPPIMS